MPTYEYQCTSCRHQFESFQWVDSRLKPTKEPCPECGKKNIKQGHFTPPAMKMDANHDINKVHNNGGFADAMERVCQSPAVKGTKYEKRLRAKHLPK